MKPFGIALESEDDISAMPAPTQAQLARQAAQWFADIQVFRAWENRHMYAEEAPS